MSVRPATLWANWRSKSARWAFDNKVTVHSAQPALPAALDDRATDNWRPLVALADVAGNPWPSRARAAALALSASRKDDGIAVALLTALKDLFATQHVHRPSSNRIVKALTADPTGMVHAGGELRQRRVRPFRTPLTK